MKIYISTQEYKKQIQYTILGEILTFLFRYCSRLVSPTIKIYLRMTDMSYFLQVPSLMVNFLKFSLTLFLPYNTQHFTLYTLDKMNTHNNIKFFNVAFPHR